MTVLLKGESIPADVEDDKTTVARHRRPCPEVAGKRVSHF